MQPSVCLSIPHNAVIAHQSQSSYQTYQHGPSPLCQHNLVVYTVHVAYDHSVLCIALFDLRMNAQTILSLLADSVRGALDVCSVPLQNARAHGDRPVCSTIMLSLIVV